MTEEFNAVDYLAKHSLSNAVHLSVDYSPLVKTLDDIKQALKIVYSYEEKLGIGRPTPKIFRMSPAKRVIFKRRLKIKGVVQEEPTLVKATLVVMMPYENTHSVKPIEFLTIFVIFEGEDFIIVEHELHGKTDAEKQAILNLDGTIEFTQTVLDENPGGSYWKFSDSPIGVQSRLQATLHYASLVYRKELETKHPKE